MHHYLSKGVQKERNNEQDKLHDRSKVRMSLALKRRHMLTYNSTFV